MLSIKDAIKRTSQKLTKMSETPHLDAILLLEKILKKSRTELFSYSETLLTTFQKKKYLPM